MLVEANLVTSIRLNPYVSGEASMRTRRSARSVFLWHMIFAVLAAVVPLGGGWYFTGSDGALFMRSGSAVVVFSLFFAVTRYSNFLTRRQTEIARALNDVRPGDEISVERTLEGIRNRFARMERDILWCQVLVAMLGTTVWGFGDLLYSYWYPAPTVVEHLTLVRGGAVERVVGTLPTDNSSLSMPADLAQRYEGGIFVRMTPPLAAIGRKGGRVRRRSASSG